MATLSSKDYTDLAPYMEVIKFYKQYGANPGMNVLDFKPIYERITGEGLNPSCGACIANALRRSYDLIKEYEDGRT